MITFKEYMEYNRKTQINKVEAAVLGIKDRSKGWKDRYANNIITQDMIDRLGLRKSRGMKATRQAANSEYRITEIENDDGKLLYLMRNPIGMLKIGVSQDPVKRARQITGACGMLIEILATWSFEKKSTIVESLVMESLTQSRLHGEWFESNSVDASYISCFLENNLKIQFTLSEKNNVDTMD